MLKVINTSIMETIVLKFFYVMIIKKMNYLNVLFTYIVTNTIGEFAPLVVKRDLSLHSSLCFHRQIMLEMELS